MAETGLFAGKELTISWNGKWAKMTRSVRGNTLALLGDAVFI
jgi:hypothetical protein